MPNDADRDERERLAIMRAAHRLVGRGGPAAVEDILRASGVNRRIFYRHFASKDALVQAMVREVGDVLGRRLTAAVAATGTTQEALLAWVDCYLGFAWDSDQVRATRTFLHTDAAPDVASVIEAIHGVHRVVLTDVLERGKADGSFPATDPEPDSFAIHAVALRHVELRIRGHSDLGLADVSATLRAMAGRITGA